MKLTNKIFGTRTESRENQEISAEQRELEAELRFRKRSSNYANLFLDLPSGIYSFGAGKLGLGDASKTMKAACGNSELNYEHLWGRGSLTGSGYGPLNIYAAKDPDDNSLVAEIKLHSGQFFTECPGIEMYSPQMPHKTRVNSSLTSIASIDDKKLRLLIANFYEELNNWRR
jgi:hypothetical protein